MSPNAHVFISVCEDSADVHAAALVRAARERLPGVDFYGLTGPRLRELGVETVYDFASHAAMLGGVLGVLGRAYQAVKAVESCWRARPPDLIVLLDSPELHLRLARKAKQLGLPVLYYIAPQTWASRAYRNRQIARCVDRLACILPFEEKYFRQATHQSPKRERGSAVAAGASRVVAAGAPPAVGALETLRTSTAGGAPAATRSLARRGSERRFRAEFVGHPLFEALRQEQPIADTVGFLKARAAGRPIVALLPGSRGHVIDAMLPKQLEVVHRLRAAGQYIYASISCVSEGRRAQIRGILAAHGVDPNRDREGAPTDLGREGACSVAAGASPTVGAPEILRISTAGTGPGCYRPTAGEVPPAPSARDADIDIVVADNASLLTAADLALVASGTATLEVAYYRKPMIVMYDAGRLLSLPYRLLGRFVVKTPHLALVNVLASARIVPEFMPFIGDLAPVAAVAGQLLTDKTWRDLMVRQLDEVVRPLESSAASAGVCRMMGEILAGW